MRNRQLGFLTLIGLVLVATPAAAYIGPGMGAGAIAVVLGILASIVMAFVAVLWYPFKRLLKKRKAAPQTATASATQKAQSSATKSAETDQS